VLSTAKDIIFFWVARMNFAGLQFEDRLPYRHVYLHSTIADDRGVTMSKSKGNGIDPLTLIEGATAEELKRPVMEARPSNLKEILNRIDKNFPNGFEAVGADAMRWTLIYSITEGEHVRLALARFLEGRAFITKLWNGAGRVLTALEAEAARGGAAEPAAPTDEDQWILARLDHTIRDVRAGLDDFDFATVAQTLYRFVWDEYCSWALELSKTRLDHADDATRRGALSVMGTALADMLRLLHPIVPFVTEELWSRLKPALDANGLWLDAPAESELLAVDRYPTPRKAPQPEIEHRFAILQRFVSAIRQLRSGYRIKDSERVVVQAKPLDPATRPMLEQGNDAVSFLARLDRIEFVEAREPGMAAVYDPAFELYLDLSKYVDLADEIARLDKDIERTQKELAGYQAKLSNEKFVGRAPVEMVQQTREKQAEAEDRLKKLTATRDELAGLVGE
jgi:valyl-tRNA synthetase